LVWSCVINDCAISIPRSIATPISVFSSYSGLPPSAHSASPQIEEAELNPKAMRGYSRDGRPDCKQVVVALAITPDGFPLAYEVMNGNTSDK